MLIHFQINAYRWSCLLTQTFVDIVGENPQPGDGESLREQSVLDLPAFALARDASIVVDDEGE